MRLVCKPSSSQLHRFGAEVRQPSQIVVARISSSRWGILVHAALHDAVVLFLDGSAVFFFFGGKFQEN